MNLNNATYIDTPGYEFMAALTELKSLVQWLENDKRTSKLDVYRCKETRNKERKLNK